MCIGSMCNGDPLPTVYRFDNANAQPIVVTYPPSGTATYPITINGFSTFTVNGHQIGKLHACPNCHCVQVNP